MDNVEIIYFVMTVIFSVVVTYMMTKNFLPDCYECGNRKNCNCLRDFTNGIPCGSPKCPIKGGRE